VANIGSDKKTRDVAVPFTAYPFNDLPQQAGDVSLIRFTKPGNMELVECYAILRITAPTGQALDFKVAIGEWQTGATTLYKAKSGSTSEWIDRSHRKITGANTKYHVNAGASTVIELNLMRDLPSSGDSNYKKDGFVLLFKFDVTPDFSVDGGIGVDVTGSALLGVL